MSHGFVVGRAATHHDHAIATHHIGGGGFILVVFAFFVARDAGVAAVGAESVRVAVVHVSAVGDDVLLRAGVGFARRGSRVGLGGWWRFLLGIGGCVGTVVAGSASSECADAFFVGGSEISGQVVKIPLVHRTFAPVANRVRENSGALDDVQGGIDSVSFGDGYVCGSGEPETISNSAPKCLDGVIGVPIGIQFLAVGSGLGRSNDSISRHQMGQHGNAGDRCETECFMLKCTKVHIIDGLKNLFLQGFAHGDVGLVFDDGIIVGLHGSRACGASGAIGKNWRCAGKDRDIKRFVSGFNIGLVLDKSFGGYDESQMSEEATTAVRRYGGGVGAEFRM